MKATLRAKNEKEMKKEKNMKYVAGCIAILIALAAYAYAGPEQPPLPLDIGPEQPPLPIPMLMAGPEQPPLPLDIGPEQPPLPIPA